MKYKVGDRVRCTHSVSMQDGGPREGQEFVVKSASENSIGIELPELASWYNPGIAEGTKTNWGNSSFELISQPSRKVVGYKLLKDLPGAPAGTRLSKVYQEESYFIDDNREDTPAYSFTTIQLQDTTWFEPIYEAEKVVVELSNGKVTLGEDEGCKMWYFKDNDGGTMELSNYWCGLVVKEFKRLEEDYGIKPLTVAIEGQTFTMEDLDKVLAALPTSN